MNRQQAGAQRFVQHYDALKRLAKSRLRRHETFTLLDTTALVHESFMRLVASDQVRAEDKAEFLAYAAQVMRSVIVDHARARLALRRGERAEHLPLDTGLGERLCVAETRVLEVNEALQVLEQSEPRLARVVEMQFFGGMTEIEIAESLGVSDRTVRRDWEKARLLLQVALR
nr:ECF-type sigma factor [uncultured Roseateles sp.]